MQKCGANRSAASNKATSWQQLIASNAPWMWQETLLPIDATIG